MDKIRDYNDIVISIKESLGNPGGNSLRMDCITNVKILRQELQTELSPQEDDALFGRPITVPDDTLREYIRITRAIRSFIFDNLDTHLLTIEKLSDTILCRRRAYERRNKHTDTRISNNIPTDGNRSVKPVVSKAEDAVAMVNKLSKEELANLMAMLGKP